MILNNLALFLVAGLTWAAWVEREQGFVGPLSYWTFLPFIPLYSLKPFVSI